MENIKEIAREKVLAFAKTHLNVDSEIVNLDDNMLSYNINSVDFIKIVVSIETEFDFEFHEDDLAMGRFTTFGEIADYVEQRLNEMEG